MSIAAECPYCETRFNLQPEMAGRSMRCPNLECRQVFLVQETTPRAGAQSTTGTKPPKPTGRGGPPPGAGGPSGAVGDFLPVLDGELVEPPTKADLPIEEFDLPPMGGPARRPAKPASPPVASGKPRPRTGRPTKPQPEPKIEVVDGAPDETAPDVVEAVVVASPPVREVVWSDEAAPPGGPLPRREKPRSIDADEPEEFREPIRRRRKKDSNLAPVILIGMLIVLFVTAGGAALYYFKTRTDSEKQQFDQANEQYAKPLWAEAQKSYEKLANDYPASENAEKYRFLADLSGLQLTVRSVTNRENPKPSFDKLRAFIEARKDSPFVKTNSPTSYAHDLFDAGKKVGEDMVGHTMDRVKEYAQDRSKAEPLARAEEMLAAVGELLAVLDRVRSKEDQYDQLTKQINEAKAALGQERHRLEVVTKIKTMLADPSDAVIDEVRRLARAENLADDPEVVELIKTAENDFIRRVRYDPDPAAPRALPPSPTAAIILAAPIGTHRAIVPGAGDEPPTVFLAVARGVLYALDEDTGDVLWAVRVGPDVFDLPAVGRVELGDGPTDLAVVASNVAGQPAIAGYVVRTGVPRWEQPLPAPVAGASVIVGSRAFVPLRDKSGTVYVFELTTGERIGRITIGQPLGPIVGRPGTGLLYIAGESRRVFEFDVDAGRNFGSPRPRCVRVLPTEHPPGTLRTPPVILGPPGNEPASRSLILCEAAGTDVMKLRAFALPPTPNLAPDAPPVLEPLRSVAEVELPGWVWFPPVTDGERLAAVTDKGQFRLFGINQPGNKDHAIFALPFPQLPPPTDDTPVPGLAVPAEDSAFWALTGGAIQKFRLSMVPKTGYSVVPAGPSTTIGVPTQPTQFNPRREIACFVVRSPQSGGCRAVAVRLRDGELLWQRQLGVVSSADPIVTGGGALLVDTDGGAVVIPPGGAAEARGVTQAPPTWSLTATPADVSGTTAMAATADGSTVFTVTPTRTREVSRWVIRRVVGGKVDHSGSVLAPTALAGRPVVFDRSLLLPGADGTVYRLVLGDGRVVPDSLSRGPQWRIDRNQAAPVCYITPVGEDDFVTSDGGRRMTRWNWPAGKSWSDGGGRWEVRERIAAPPLLLPSVGGRPARLLVADTTGGVWLYGLRGGEPLRQWLPGRTASLPGGKITGFATRTDAAGRQMVVFSVDQKRLVCLNADQDDLRWATAPRDELSRVVGLPQPVGEDRWLVTDLAGQVAIVDGETGQTGATKEVGLPGTVPEAAAVMVGEGRAIVPLSDGSVSVVEFPSPAPAAAPKEKE